MISMISFKWLWYHHFVKQNILRLVWLLSLYGKTTKPPQPWLQPSESSGSIQLVSTVAYVVQIAYDVSKR